jgi:hypothetical protein
VSDRQQGPGWWLASDGKWYPPESRPGSPEGGPSGTYPVDFSVDYGDGSRSKGLAGLGAAFFLKGLLLIPHFFVIAVVGFVTMIAVWFGYWAILFTGRQPAGISRLAGGVIGWGNRVTAWLVSTNDEYPPFQLWPEDSPTRLTVEDDGRPRSRGLALAGIFFVKFLLALPHLVIVGALQYAAWLIGYVTYWLILITGTVPRGLHDFQVSVLRWNARTSAWIFSLTDVYPPFSFR